MTTDTVRPDFRTALVAESARFHAVLANADPATPVPSCPGWSAADLLWHLAEVQSFWTSIIGGRPDCGPDAAEAAAPSRPDGADELRALGVRATEQLVSALDGASDDERAWSWAADDTVGFTRRRQAHEALIHRLDAELVVGAVTPVDAMLAADGVGELFEHFFTWTPAWAEVRPGPWLALVRAADVDRTWLVEPAGFSGTRPDTGKVYDHKPFLRLAAAGGDPTFTVSGRAADLDAWLWGRRGVEGIALDGPADHVAAFTSVVAEGIQ